MSTAKENISQTLPDGAIDLGNGMYAIDNGDGTFTVEGNGHIDDGTYGQVDASKAGQEGVFTLPGGTVEGFDNDTYWQLKP